MPCFVQVLIIITRSSTITLGRNHCHLALLLESLNHTFIGIYPLSARSVSAESSLSRTSAPSRSQEESRSQMKADWIAREHQPGHESWYSIRLCCDRWLRSTHPPFAPELCWWERTMVESIMAYSLSASLAKWSNICCHTPRFAHRLKRVWTTRKSPNRSGKSRQGMPAR